MEAKSPFEEIFESKHKDTEKQEDFVKEEDTYSRYFNLILELLKKKYYFEAIEVIKELAIAKIE